jgi:hypothetical protein
MQPFSQLCMEVLKKIQGITIKEICEVIFYMVFVEFV